MLLKQSVAPFSALNFTAYEMLKEYGATYFTTNRFFFYLFFFFFFVKYICLMCKKNGHLVYFYQLAMERHLVLLPWQVRRKRGRGSGEESVDDATLFGSVVSARLVETTLDGARTRRGTAKVPQRSTRRRDHCARRGCARFVPRHPAFLHESHSDGVADLALVRSHEGMLVCCCVSFASRLFNLCCLLFFNKKKKEILWNSSEKRKRINCK